MKVLFIYPNLTMETLVPIHIPLLSACLKEKGFDVDLFDATFYKTDEINFEQKRVELLQFKPFNLAEKGLQLKQTDIYEDLVKKVEEYQPDLICVTVVEDTWQLTQSLLKRIKHFNIPIIAGGVFVTLSPEEVINNEYVDMICQGEGEEALTELCQKISKGEDYSNIKNIWIKNNGKIIKNELRPLTNINTLPFIDYDLFGKERLYRPMFGKIYTIVQIEMDRGCPYNCTFCSAPHLKKIFQESDCGLYYRRKSVDKLMAELRHLFKKYQPNYIYFNSETFLAKPIEELKELAEKYKEINLPFWCQTRPETITEEKVKILKTMGCNSINFGIEQGNEAFRSKILNRHYSNEQVVAGLKIVEKYQIPYAVNNVIGFPDETRDLIFDTIELNRQLNSRTVNVLLFTPYKGTYLYDYCIKKGYLDKGALIGDHPMIEGVDLKMDSISLQELKGLQRTFNLYVRFSKSEWPEIRKAEKFNEEGNKVFEKYKKIYQEKYF